MGSAPVLLACCLYRSARQSGPLLCSHASHKAVASVRAWLRMQRRRSRGRQHTCSSLPVLQASWACSAEQLPHMAPHPCLPDTDARQHHSRRSPGPQQPQRPGGAGCAVLCAHYAIVCKHHCPAVVLLLMLVSGLHDVCRHQLAPRCDGGRRSGRCC